MEKKFEVLDNGITLIALIITIILLLILAGITIGTLTGENGILTKASQAEEETRATNVEELKNLWKIAKETDKYNSTKNAQSLEELLNDLEKQKLITPEERTEIENTGEVTIGSKRIIFGKLLELNLAELESKTTNSITIKAKGIDEGSLTYYLYVREEGKDWNLGQTLKNQNPDEEVYLTAENLTNYTYYDWYVSITNDEETTNSEIGEKVRTKCPSGLVECTGPFSEIVTCPVCNGNPKSILNCPGNAKTTTTIAWSAWRDDECAWGANEGLEYHAGNYLVTFYCTLCKASVCSEYWCNDHYKECIQLVVDQYVPGPHTYTRYCR